MKEITLSDYLESIGLFAFSETGLKTVEFPTSVRKIFQGAFYKCENLKTVKFNEGLEVLGTDEYSDDGKTYFGVFEESAVERVELPSTLRRIEYRVFENCKNLKNI